MLFHTTACLRWIIYLGFSLAAIGLAAALVVLHRYFFLDVEPGWTSLALVSLLMGGANIAAVGVVGLYLGRIFEQVRDRPLYVVDEEAGGETTEVAIAVEALAARRSA